MKLSVVDHFFLLVSVVFVSEAQAFERNRFNFLAGNSILARRGNIFQKPTNPYPINECSHPDWPGYTQFVASHCVNETSFFLLCANPTRHLTNLYEDGECPEDYICRTSLGDGTMANPPIAWCTVRSQTNSAAGSSDGSENGSSENGGSESSGSYHS